MLSTRENLKKAIEFNNPDWVPITIYFSPYAKNYYKEEIKDIEKKYGIIFERDNGFHNFDIFSKMLGSTWKKGSYIDNWGCVWESRFNGIELPGIGLGPKTTAASSLGKRVLSTSCIRVPRIV